MQLSNIPTKYQIPWANSAGGSYIRTVPVASQIGVQNGAASFTDGFVPENFTAVTAGGVPPFGQDFNGLLNVETAWTQWFQAGGPVYYDGTFATEIGGYPQGAMVQSNVVAGNFYVSTADNNTTDPDSAASANWIGAPGLMTTGFTQWRPTAEVLTGWVRANGLTLGSAASGATGLASASALLLYRWLWTNFSNSVCPVTGGRGANATADFNANKPIQLLAMQACAPAGVDTMGGGTTTYFASVPVVSGSATAPGSVLGESLHQLTQGELPAVSPTFTGNLGSVSFSGTFTGSPSSVSVTSTISTIGTTDLVSFQSYSSGPLFRSNTTYSSVNSTGSTTASGSVSGSGSTTPSGTISALGSGSSHNTVQRTMLGTWYLKL